MFSLGVVAAAPEEGEAGGAWAATRRQSFFVGLGWSGRREGGLRAMAPWTAKPSGSWSYADRRRTGSSALAGACTRT